MSFRVVQITPKSRDKAGLHPGVVVDDGVTSLNMYWRHRRSHPGAWPLTRRWILLSENVKNVVCCRKEHPASTQLLPSVMMQNQGWFTPRNLKLSAWWRSSFMSTSVNPDTGEVSISDTCQADSSIQLEVILFILLFFCTLHIKVHKFTWCAWPKKYTLSGR